MFNLIYKIMEKRFLIECLAQWEKERTRVESQIKRYESGDRPMLLAMIYERGDYHRTLEKITQKIADIKKMLAA